MEKNFDHQDIHEFYKNYKNLPQSSKLDKVHQIIHNPNAKATHRIRNNYKPLKFIIMTSAIIVGIAAVMRTISPIQEVEEAKFSNAFTPEKVQHVTEKLVEHKPERVERSLTTENDNAEAVEIEAGIQVAGFSNPKSSEHTKITGNSGKESANRATCSWPTDTTLDKHGLFIYLSDEELLKLGVYLYADSMYYCHQRPNGSSYVSGYNARGGKERCNNYRFYMKYSSDTLCTSHRWGDPFYARIDTLLPVVINISDESKILWFTAHPDIFEALPLRYRFLKSIYKELICQKKRNPDFQIVNYWSAERNLVLDEVNYLSLSNEELEKIGIDIYKDSISLVDPTNTYRYSLDYKMLNCGTYSQTGVIQPEIPNLFPTLFTDIKGLNQGTYGSWMESKSSAGGKDVFNTLIPVFLPISKLIRGKSYDLILWYYPTEDFLDALPKRYGMKIKSEITYINSGISNKNANCTYFEACKSSLKVENFRIYPNPAIQSATIEFSLTEQLEGDIMLVSISGKLVKHIVTGTSFIAGKNSIPMNLNGVPPGIYLISIVSEKGFKTQRFIKAK